MPKIKIKRGTASELSDKTLSSGELALSTDTQHLYAGTSDEGTSLSDSDNVSVKYAEKIGSSKSSHPSIGGDTNEDGHGSSPHYGLKPVYVNSDGEITAATRDHGNSTTPVYVKDGGIQRCTGNVGGDDTPVYKSDGTITPCTKYGGGTKVTLNGTPLGGQDATIYAPTDVPTGGVAGTRILLCQLNGTPFWSTGSAGAANKPMYLYNGRLLSGDKYAGGTNVTLNGTPKGAADASFYAPESIGSAGNIVWTDGSTIGWTDVPCTNTLYANDTDTDQTVTLQNVPIGIYAILAKKSGYEEYYTFYITIHKVTTINTMFYSTSFVTQPDSGNPHSCRILATVGSSNSVTFKIEEDAAGSWYFRRIYKVNKII